MLKRSWQIILLGIFLLSISVGLIGFIHLNQVFAGNQPLIFKDPAEDQLIGTYYPGSKPVGILMLEGFGSDQIAMKPASQIFLKAGAHVFTFDFSGHGRSQEGLGFDNAATDRLARQVIAAKETFKGISGLTDEQILYFGHSMGARVGLQAAVLDPKPPIALILVGTQVNLEANVQASFFTGTSDSTLDWVGSLSADIPQSHILLLSGSLDDVLTPENAQNLEKKLTSGEPSNFIRKLTIIPGLVHNYEIYSARLLDQAAEQVEDLGLITFDQRISLTPYYIFGVLTLLGLLGLLILLPMIIGSQKAVSLLPPETASISHPGLYLRGKLLLWLGGIPITLILTGLFFLIPLDLPVLNMIYVGFIGGYGILMLVLYRVGKVPGLDGKWNLWKALGRKESIWKEKNFWLGILFWLSILVVCVIFTRSGLFYVFPINQRLAWLIIFSPITALGFWVGTQEKRLLNAFQRQSGLSTQWQSILLDLIGLTPFFIYTVFMGILGSLSGMIGGLQGLLILLIVLQTGRLLEYFIAKPWVVAFLQALILYALILPQGALFTF